MDVPRAPILLSAKGINLGSTRGDGALGDAVGSVQEVSLDTLTLTIQG